MVSSSGRTYEWEVVICKLELGIIGIYFINKEGDFLVVFVALDRPAYLNWLPSIPD
jgi:hypothetical protein